MFDTRLIHQVVDLERRMEIENEKKGSSRPFVNPPFAYSLEYCSKAVKSLFTQISKLNKGSYISTHPSKSDLTI